MEGKKGALDLERMERRRGEEKGNERGKGEGRGRSLKRDGEVEWGGKRKGNEGGKGKRGEEARREIGK